MTDWSSLPTDINELYADLQAADQSGNEAAAAIIAKRINMVKNSTFRNMPNSMVEMGSKPENNVLPADRMDRIQQAANQGAISGAAASAENQRKKNK